jgi:hypothetical protein
VNLALGKLRQDLAELAEAHERFAADDRYVQRPVTIDQRHEARNQLVAFVVGEAAQA